MSGLRPSPAFLTRFRSEAVQAGVDTRRATGGPAGVLDSTSRIPRERNAGDMLGSAAAVESCEKCGPDGRKHSRLQSPSHKATDIDEIHLSPVASMRRIDGYPPSVAAGARVSVAAPFPLVLRRGEEVPEGQAPFVGDVIEVGMLHPVLVGIAAAAPHSSCVTGSRTAG